MSEKMAFLFALWIKFVLDFLADIRDRINRAKGRFFSGKSHTNNSSSSSNVGNENETKDPFEILGLTGGKENTTLEEATKARRKLALKWHPDRNIDNAEEATKKMQQINDAFHQVEKILEGGGDNDDRDGATDSDDESVVYESEAARKKAEEKKWRQQEQQFQKEKRAFEKKMQEEFDNFDKTQRNAARGIFTTNNHSAPNGSDGSNSQRPRLSKAARKRARQKRAKARREGNKAQCSHTDMAMDMEGGRNMHREKKGKEVPFHQLPPEKRCEIKFQSKFLAKAPTFTGELSYCLWSE